MTPIGLKELHRGMTFGFHAKNGLLGSDWGREQVDKMAALNIKWVVLCPTVLQDTYSSVVQYRDFEVTPDDSEIRHIIDYMHEKGMRVHLRPMLETQDGHGRLQVWFPPDRERIPGRSTDYWQRWFHFMKLRTIHYARIAQETGCEMYGLDSELDRTVHQDDHWKDVIAAARSVYSGPIVTSHTYFVDFLAEVERENHWWYECDMLQASFYRPAADKPGATVDEMVAFLQSEIEYWEKIASIYGKPILFGECGCTARTGAALRPADWGGFDAKYDGQEQANFLEAVLRCFWDKPWWYGLYWWKWDEQFDREYYHTDPAGDKSFSIDGKPAADVMKTWYGREDR